MVNPPATPLTLEQIDWVITKVSHWIQLYGTHKLTDHGRGTHTIPSSADADHSALLRRLLSGKQALLKPPPLRFSYPAYELAEGEPVQLFEQPYQTESLHEFDSHTWVIDHHRGWKQLHEGLFEYQDGSLYRLYQRDDKTYLQRIPER